MYSLNLISECFSEPKRITVEFGVFSFKPDISLKSCIAFIKAVNILIVPSMKYVVSCAKNVCFMTDCIWIKIERCVLFL